MTDAVDVRYEELAEKARVQLDAEWSDIESQEDVPRAVTVVLDAIGLRALLEANERAFWLLCNIHDEWETEQVDDENHKVASCCIVGDFVRLRAALAARTIEEQK